MARQMTSQTTSQKAADAEPSKTILTTTERRKLAGASLCTEDTIRRWEKGEPMRPTTKAALDEFARKFRLPMPIPRKRA